MEAVEGSEFAPVRSIVPAAQPASVTSTWHPFLRALPRVASLASSGGGGIARRCCIPPYQAFSG
jgi:hypothetical protein